MYLSLRNRPEPTRGAPPTAKQRVAGAVIVLGIVSLVTDISYESLSAVRPNYLLAIVGLTPTAFGVVNGLYNGASALIQIVGGWIADRTDHPKWVALAGYATSAVSTVLLLPATSFAQFSAIATADQMGKGVRTAPRDNMITATSPPEQLGRAFGVHRMLDSTGAFLGPLLAFWILSVVPNDIHSVFVSASAFSIIGVVALLLIVPDLRPRRMAHARGQGPMRRPSLRHLANPILARLLVAAGLLGLLSIGEAYVFLELQQRDSLAAKYYALLLVGMNLSYLLFAIPLGRLADRIGRWRVFLMGYGALIIAYLGAGGPVHGAVATYGCLVLLGGYYAATDGMLAAMAGRAADPSVRTSAIATAQTTLAVAAFCSSLGFAYLWVRLGRADALLIAALALAVVLPVAGLLLRSMHRLMPEDTA
jgi:MFS family permease